MDRIVECVPNFSEGRDLNVIKAITDEIEATNDVELLDCDPGADTNRTVVTFIGSPDGVKEAAFKAIKKASELIDMSQHSGAHPRMGATDVCPFVPVSGVTMDDCVDIARDVGKRVGIELGIPIYLYEHAASSPGRRNLADVRSGEYEALEEKLADPEWKPDFGPSSFNAGAGATVIGAREFLIAYNVNINSRDKKLATEIALEIREAGRNKRGPDGKFVRDENGVPIKRPGRLKSVKAVGWYIDEYSRAQVSINLTNHNITPLHEVFDASVEEGEKIGVRVTGSELVGLIPKEPLLEAGRHYLRRQNRSTGVPESELVNVAVQSMGLDELSPFVPEEKVIEYRLATKPPLVTMTVKDFIEEVSVDSPAPGGGSVAALGGAIGAALASMVANLTVGKKKYKDHWNDMDAAAVEAQQVMDRLVKAIDADTEAFNGVITAKRLPKSTDEEIAARDLAIQEGFKEAAMVPFQTAEACLEVIPVAKKVAEKGNKNSITDAAVAALMADAGVKGAVLNVLINLGDIEDQAFKDDLSGKCDDLVKRSTAATEDVMVVVREIMND